MADDKTIHLRDKMAQLSGGGDRTTRLNNNDRMIRPGNISVSPQTSAGYQLNNIIYHSLKVISEGTGEAQVFQVEHQGRPYVLKLYYPEAHPNRQILNILKRVGRSGVLVELIDYGTYVDSETGEERDYELMEFAGGGSLIGFKLEKDADRLRGLAMQAAISLDFCHQNGIIHRDVKPGNFLFADEAQERLLLSDFGIAMFCLDPTRPSPSEQTRTPVYAAPELYQHVIDGIVEIDRKVDFYSLGLVLLYLWLGEDFIKGDERVFMKRKSRGDLPYPDDLPIEMLTLLRGLTIVDPAKRWGFDEIKSWYRGEAVAVEMSTNKEMNIVFSSAQRLVAHSAQELARFMRDYPALGIKYLYSGRITEWLYEYDLPDTAIEVDHVVEVNCPKNQQEGLRAAYYTIDPEMPYMLECGEEGEKTYLVECMTADDVIRAFRDHPVTKEGRRMLTDFGFLAWFSHREEPVIYEELKTIIQAGTDNVFDVIFTLNKRISFHLYFPDEADKPDYCFSAKQIAEYITGRMASAYYRQKYADPLTGEGVEQPEDTLKRLFAYFKSKGWIDAITWVKSCFEFDSQENREKCSNYPIAVATYRGIKGLGFSPYYLFPNCGKKVFAPEELADVPQAEIQVEIERGRLKEWLTIFYHEDPYIAFNEKYDFEKQVKAYLLKLKELYPAESCVLKYTAAKALVKKSIRHIDKCRTLFLNVRWLFTTLTMLPLLILGVFSVMKKFPIADTMLPLFPWKIFLAVFVGSAFWQFIISKFKYQALLRWGELRNVVLIYYLTFIVLHLIPDGYAWIYMLCVVIALIVHVIRTPLISVKIPSLTADRGFEIEELEPLYHAFKDAQPFQSTQKELNDKKASAFTKAARRFVRIIVPSMVLAWVLLIAYIYYHPTMSLIGGPKLPGYEHYSTMEGSYWRGLVDQQPVQLMLENVNAYSGEVEGDFSWGTKEDESIPVKGMLDMTEGKLTFEVAESGTAKLDGAYTATFNEGSTELTGVAQISKKGAEFFVHRQKGTFRLKTWWKSLDKITE